MYGKIFEQIYDSTLREDPIIRLVFMDMIVLADKDGIVDITQEALSARTNIKTDDIYRAIEKLSQKDPRSRSKKDDGARIKLLDDHRDWGWEIVNYEHYLKKGSYEHKKKQDRERIAKKRKDNKPVATCRKESQPVRDVAHIDIDIDKDIKKKKLDKKKECDKNDSREERIALLRQQAQEIQT